MKVLLAPLEYTILKVEMKLGIKKDSEANSTIKHVYSLFESDF